MSDEARVITQGAVTGSRRHLVWSVIIGVAVMAFELRVAAAPAAYILVLGIFAFLVAFNLLRIRRAKLALASGDEAVQAFARGQRQSHLVRGRVVLAVTPPLLIGGWIFALTGADTARLVAMVITTLLLVWGWVTWWRALPRIARWGR